MQKDIAVNVVANLIAAAITAMLAVIVAFALGLFPTGDETTLYFALLFVAALLICLWQIILFSRRRVETGRVVARSLTAFACVFGLLFVSAAVLWLRLAVTPYRLVAMAFLGFTLATFLFFGVFSGAAIGVWRVVPRLERQAQEKEEDEVRQRQRDAAMRSLRRRRGPARSTIWIAKRRLARPNPTSSSVVTEGGRLTRGV